MTSIPRPELDNPVSILASLVEETEAALTEAAASWRGRNLTNQDAAALLFLHRGEASLEAICLLADKRLLREAMTVMRAFCEDVVTLEYLTADFETRYPKWLGHCNTRHAYYLELARRTFVQLGRPQPGLESRIDAMGGVRSGPSRDRWDVGFGQMARSVADASGKEHFQMWFDLLYPELCDAAHGYMCPWTCRSLAYKAHEEEEDTVDVLFKTVYIASGLMLALRGYGLDFSPERWLKPAVRVWNDYNSRPGGRSCAVDEECRMPRSASAPAPGGDQERGASY